MKFIAHKYKYRKNFVISNFIDRKVSRQIRMIRPIWTWISTYWRKSDRIFLLYLNKDFSILIFKFLIKSDTLWCFFQHLLFKLHEKLKLFIFGFSQKGHSGSLHRPVSNNAFDLTFFILIDKFFLSLLLRKYFFFFSSIHLNGLFFIFFYCLIVNFWLLLELISVANPWC